MGTIINLNDIDFENLLIHKRITIKIQESNSFAVTTAKKDEIITARHRDRSVNALIVERQDVVINKDLKQILLLIQTDEF